MHIYIGIEILQLTPFLFRLKDTDVTWLYGPLQASGDTDASLDTDQHLCTSSSIGNKPILKKRSISERILKSSSAAPPGVEDGWGLMARSASGCSLIRDGRGVSPSTAYGPSYLRHKRKCVHFGGQVEQFVIESEGDGVP